MKFHWRKSAVYEGNAPLDGRMRLLAEKISGSGRSRLHMSAGTAWQLRRVLEQAKRFGREEIGGEALSRLNADAKRIETCLRTAETEKKLRLPGRPVPRILALARCMLMGGEQKIDRETLLQGIAAFDAVRPLRMRELECLPSALRIALCEAVLDTAADILQFASDCRHARRWALHGGKLPRRCNAAFLARACRLCMEGEDAHRLEQRMKLRCMAHAAEDADRMEARLSLRLDNLLQLHLLLEELNWQKCFDALSIVEHELREDAVYAAMDAPSRAQARICAAELADAFCIGEAALVRCALKLAREQRETVCFYLMDDAGRAALRSSIGRKVRLRRRIPDPAGNKTAITLCAGFVVLAAVCCAVIGMPALWMHSLPLAWVFLMQLAGLFVPKLVKPKPLPRIKVKEIPEEARTLVTLPVLLSSPARAEEMLRHMEMLGCLERDDNLDFLLLGDFRDADEEVQAEDASILETVRRGVAQLNAGCVREKYFYLHRGRSYRLKDERWMGEGRKRGALTALNRLLLGQPAAEEAFSAESGAARKLAGRYKYVVTLDADTQYLPGTLQKLIGAMLHPLNRKYALLQPCMQATIASNVNAYTDLAFAAGGVDSYPVSVSDLWQDITGYGNFSGKGIYDVRAFAAATDGVLPDAEILSHDLIEGILCGAGFVSDVCFYDGSPDNLSAELGRQHRWTRGDWQLLRVIFSKLPICALDRLKMIGNLLRSLHAPAVLGLLVGAVWLDSPGAYLLGLLALFMDALSAPFDAKAWKRALLRLSVLPAVAARSADAILRALWRLFVSRKHLMDWVPAADSSAAGQKLRMHGRIAAILLLPGLLNAWWIPGVLALALLFWVGADHADDLAQKKLDTPAPLTEEHARLVNTIAAETWHFFESFVTEDSAGLPPDNVQFDPPAGAACRTSPTNIGLYMMSCVSARELGLISDEKMHVRLSRTVEALEKLDKWQGQLYNWYDTEQLMPIQPRYVSSVDSGNLAAALLLCSRAVENELARRMRRLAEGMRLDALYDHERHLFFIGMDAENGCMSHSHYDLYASESRILSYAAMMLQQVPVKHWAHLGRPSEGNALLSWSGTMFEYLMPELLLHSHRQSLAGRSKAAAVQAQMDYGRKMQRPWGVSESGHYAFDLQLNYQYHAFGLKALAMSGSAMQDVTAPYASALALCCVPNAAAENLQRMRALGWSNAFGMIEAADYRNPEEPRLVRSCMAHHQGMILCAACNALKGNVLNRLFMENPEARALSLLLQERPAVRRPSFRRRRIPETTDRRKNEMPFRRIAGEGRACESHLLCSGGTSVLATARGAAFIRRGSLLLNRFSGDLRSRHEGAYIHMEDIGSGEKALFGADGRAVFDAGSARYELHFDKLLARLELAVSPEDGAFYQCVTLENRGGEERLLAVTGCMAVALAHENDMRAHPCFQNLFVEARQLENAILLNRRQREKQAFMPDMLYLCSEDAEVETDLEKLVGRSGCVGLPGGIATEFSGTEGPVLNPCAALRCHVRVPAGGSMKLHFALFSGERCEEKLEMLKRSHSAERAVQLSGAYACAALRHSGMEPKLYRLADRAAALLMDAGLRVQRHASQACEPLGRAALWQAGISGELPILLAECRDGGSMEQLHALLSVHAFYRAMGIESDLVLVDAGEGGYLRPARDAIEKCLRASHLHDLRGVSGGVFILDGSSAGLEAVRRAAALSFTMDEGIAQQLMRMSEGLKKAEYTAWNPMEAVRMEKTPALEYFNGYGGFAGEDYVILLKDGMLPPAPWSNIISTENSGAVMTERGGGFCWSGNSRSGRITPFANDVLREGWGWMFYLLDEKKRSWMRLLPGDKPMTDFAVRFGRNFCRWEGACGAAVFRVEAAPVEGGIAFTLEMENRGKTAAEWRFAAAVDWLLGVDGLDRCMLRTWKRGGMCFASGASGVGCLAADDPLACPGGLSGSLLAPDSLDEAANCGFGNMLRLPLHLKSGERRRVRFRLCAAESIAAVQALARDFGKDMPVKEASLRIETPDRALNLLVNGFLPAQLKHARILARTGLYQPGGAYGFRDQLQDMLPLIYTEPRRVREHLLRCAARQFEDGDVLHWWHEPCTGVRTRISDDLLFLPYVTAKYVSITGDAAVLDESVPFLKSVEIPEGKEDIYAQMQPSQISASLHSHCMRAFMRASRTGEHGLCLMGAGDWNDGMNRVGAQGRGESVWLTEFLAACAADYARIAPDEDDRAWLLSLKERMCAAVEESGWDGAWYLRAYADDGTILGGRDSACCRIDAIAQAWAVLAGLDEERCASAMEAAWEQLADEASGVIRLLAPPFDGKNFDPGYIAAYPPGIRENGAQYTHAACWLALVLIRMGDEKRAHRALEMLLPLKHADTKEKADVYRVEPYVMAADVYTDALHAGRGGWTWYTGSAAWMLMAVYALLGFEKRGKRVRLHALLGDWRQVSLTLQYGKSSYELVCCRDACKASLDGVPADEWVELIDDGMRHRAVFPPRRPSGKSGTKAGREMPSGKK